MDCWSCAVQIFLMDFSASRLIGYSGPDVSSLKSPSHNESTKQIYKDCQTDLLTTICPKGEVLQYAPQVETS
jgi:hypothetical protein